MRHLLRETKELYTELDKFWDAINGYFLRKMPLIATTVAQYNLHKDMLEQAGPFTLVVDEAAEVLDRLFMLLCSAH